MIILKENKDGTKFKVVSGLAWTFFERCGAEGVSFVVSIILARLLDPVVYGTVALVNIFSSVLSVFIDRGMGSALIQKKDSDDLDFSSLFYFNCVLCLVLYAIMFFAAIPIANFYERPELVWLIRVSSITLLISAVKNIQCSYVSKHMMFKKFFLATLGGTIGAAIIGIVMAYLGYGPWALVAQGLFNNIVDTIILWFTVKWRPKKLFSIHRVKYLFSFGWKLLVSGILDTVYTKLRQLVIGKMYDGDDLAYYNRGNAYPQLVVTNINSSINSVLFPALSSVQDNIESVKNLTRRSIRISTYIMMPMMMGLAVCAKPIVRILLTDKWLPCVPYVWIFCFTYAFYPVHTANLGALKALGKSGTMLVLEIIKKIIGLAAIISTMWFGVIYMALSAIAVSILSQIVNSWPNRKILGYSYLDQLKDILPSVGISVIMGTIVYCVTFLGLNDWITLIIQVPLGMALYVGLSLLFKFESFDYVWSIVKGILPKKKQIINQ